MDTNPKKVVGYIRSAVGGPEGDRSAVAQKAVMQGFANLSGSQVVDWYVDVGCSGNGLNGPALQRLLDAAQSDERTFDEVLVVNFSRLTRNSLSAAFALKQFRSAGVGLVSVYEHDVLSPGMELLDSLVDSMDVYSQNGLR